MNYIEIQKKHDHISKLIVNYDISNAIKLLFDFAGNTKKQYHHIKIEKIKDTYSNILKHSFTGIEDPEKDKIYSYVQRSLLELTDSIKECILTETSDLTIYKMKWSMEKNMDTQSDEAFSLIKNLTFDTELDKILKDNNIEISSGNKQEFMVNR